METTQKQYSTKNTTYTKANISNSNNITLTAKLTELNSKLTEMHGKDIDNTKLYNVIAQLSHISRETGRGFNFKVGTTKKWAVVSMAKQRHGYVNHNIRTEAYRDEEGGKLETANICSNVGLYDLRGILQRYKL